VIEDTYFHGWHSRLAKGRYRGDRIVETAWRGRYGVW
jgi:hypothetical protein